MIARWLNYNPDNVAHNKSACPFVLTLVKHMQADLLSGNMYVKQCQMNGIVLERMRGCSNILGTELCVWMNV